MPLRLALLLVLVVRVEVEEGVPVAECVVEAEAEPLRVCRAVKEADTLGEEVA